MKRVVPIAVLIAGLTIGCGDDSGPGGSVTLADLAGTWEITALEFTNLVNPGESVDLIGLGGDAALTIAGSGAYTIVVLSAGDDPDVSGGFMVVEGDVLLVTDNANPGETVAFVVTLSGGTLTLVTDEAEYDFGGDDEPEIARLRVAAVGTTGTSVAELAGEWEATEYRIVSDTRTDTVDVIGSGGSASLTIMEDGQYAASIPVPGEPSLIETGTVYIDDPRLALINAFGSSEPTVLSFQLAGDALSLEAQGEFDFDSDGNDEAAVFEIAMQRQ